MARTEPGTYFEVRLHFVDDTYWDEGGRWTNRVERRDTIEEAYDLAREALKGEYKFKGRTGEPGLARSMSFRDVQVFQVTTTCTEQPLPTEY